jgi:hypothetical protein
MRTTLQSIKEKLEASGVKVVRIEQSKDLDLYDHSIILENSFYLTISPECSEIFFWCSLPNNKEHWICELPSEIYPKIIKHKMEKITQFIDCSK